MLWKRNVSIAANLFAAAQIKNSVLTSAEITIIIVLTVIQITLYAMFMDYYGRTEGFWQTSMARENTKFIRMPSLLLGITSPSSLT